MSETGASPALPRYFSWQGRLNRICYFCQMAGLIFLGSALALIVFLLPTDAWSASYIWIGAIGGISGLVGLIVLASLPTIKRLHDLGWSGWWFGLFPLPVVGTVLFFVLLFKKGIRGPNPYGCDPLTCPSSAARLLLWALVPAAPAAAIVLASAVLLLVRPDLFQRVAAGPGGAGSGKDIVATVNGAAISAAEFRTVLRNSLQRLSPAVRQDPELLRALRLDRSILEEMIRQELLMQEAARRGISVTPDEVALRIRGIPAFVRGGAFVGVDKYRQLLASNGISPAEFEQEARKGMLIEKLTEALTQDMRASDAEAQSYFVEQNDRAEIKYVLLGEEAFQSRVTVSEPVLMRYLETNRAKYRLEETRRIRYVRMTPAGYAAKLSAALTEATLRAEYDARRSDLYPDRVQASHILVRASGRPDDPAVREARRKAEGILSQVRAPGADFARLAVRLSDDVSAASGGELGYFERGRMIPEFENAAFSLNVGETSGIVTTQFGFHIIRVTGRQGYDHYRERVRRDMAQREAAARLETSARAAAIKLEQTGNFELIAQETGGTAGESRPFNERRPDSSLADAAALVREVFGLVQDGYGPPCIAGTDFILFRLHQVIPPHDPDLAEVRDWVEGDFRRLEAGRLARDAAERLLRSAVLGGGLSGAAAAFDLKVSSPAPFTRAANIDGRLGRLPELTAAVFKLEPGATGGPVASPLGLVVFQVTRRTRPDMAQFQADSEGVRRQLLDKRKQDYLDAFAAQLVDHCRRENKLQIYQERLDSIVGK